MTGVCLCASHPQGMQGDTFLKTANTFRMFGCFSYFVGCLYVCGCEAVGRGRRLHNNSRLSLPSVCLPLSVFLSFQLSRLITLSFLPSLQAALFPPAACFSTLFSPFVYLSLSLCLLYWSVFRHNKQMRFSDGLDPKSDFPWHRLALCMCVWGSGTVLEN